jgi:AcrR family transcriptional regulator
LIYQPASVRQQVAPIRIFLKSQGSCARRSQRQIFVDSTEAFVHLYKAQMIRVLDSDEAAPRKSNMREAILCAAEELFSTKGFDAVSVRDIAQAAGANPGSVTYHFKTKDGLLLEIYRRHCGPMNRRRSELLAAARRVRDLNDRLEAIVRAYVLPAFSSGNDLAGGGARFTRLRAVMSAEGNEVAGRIIAQTFDDTSHAFIDAIHESLPQIPRTEIVWRSHFLLGALYYSLVTPERVSRLSRGEADGTDAANAIEQLVRATVASLRAQPLDRGASLKRRMPAPAKN